MKRKKTLATHKYNRTERIIARKIHDLKSYKLHCFNKYQELDMKENLLKQQLNGKYIERKRTVLGLNI